MNVLANKFKAVLQKKESSLFSNIKSFSWKIYRIHDQSVCALYLLKG